MNVRKEGLSMTPAGYDPREDFTLVGYRRLMLELVRRGYHACRFDNVDPEAPGLVLRHDLDMSVDAALPIAEIESGLGLVATYFVLVRSEMYNPLSERTVTALQGLVALGHDIGLHFDFSRYNGDQNVLDEAVKKECLALETFIGRPVAMVSFHRPAPELHGLDRQVGGRHHAYEPKFFTGMGYCSDSRGGWYHGHPLDHAAVGEGRALQLLTHPIWWQAAPNETVRDKLDRFALRRFDLLRAELARNCTTYPQEFKALG